MALNLTWCREITLVHEETASDTTMEAVASMFDQRWQSELQSYIARSFEALTGCL